MTSPIGISTPTINDQEFPDNSLLNDNDSSIWLTDTPCAIKVYNEFGSVISNNNYQTRLDSLNLTRDDNVSAASIDSVIPPNYANNSLVALENLLPDYLTNDEKEENSLKREYETLVKMNKMFEKINNNMDQARINLQQFSTTVDQTDQLLDLWIGILSQSVHTQQILCDPSWHGDSTEKMRILEEQAQKLPK